MFVESRRYTKEPPGLSGNSECSEGVAEDVPAHGQGACDLAEVRLNEAEVRNALEVQAAELGVRP